MRSLQSARPVGIALHASSCSYALCPAVTWAGHERKDVGPPGDALRFPRRGHCPASSGPGRLHHQPGLLLWLSPILTARSSPCRSRSSPAGPRWPGLAHAGCSSSPRRPRSRHSCAGGHARAPHRGAEPGRLTGLRLGRGRSGHERPAPDASPSAIAAWRRHRGRRQGLRTRPTPRPEALSALQKRILLCDPVRWRLAPRGRELPRAGGQPGGLPPSAPGRERMRGTRPARPGLPVLAWSSKWAMGGRRPGSARAAQTLVQVSRIAAGQTTCSR
jgi:hypothetical protein